MITINNPNRSDNKPLSPDEVQELTELLNSYTRGTGFDNLIQRLIDSYQNLQHFYDAVGGWDGISEMHNRLNNQLSEIQAMPQWIDVNDRLPPPQVDVIVYLKSERRATAMWYYKERACFQDDVSGCSYFKEVTHWQPLPEPPKNK